MTAIRPITDHTNNAALRRCGAAIECAAMEHAVKGAFLIAYLLTANDQHAEAAVMQALDWTSSRNQFPENDFPGERFEKALFHTTIRTAVHDPSENVFAVARRQPGGSQAPAPEIQAVLNLSPNLRHCFVLRMLGGFSSGSCAEVLGKTAQDVDELTCAALRRLGRQTWRG